MNLRHIYYPILCLVGLLYLGCTSREPASYYDQIVDTLKDSVLILAEQGLQLPPVTITKEVAVRSAGNKHDFYSEGDYWWPDPEDPEGPYIRKDGMTNPDNFVAHRRAVMRFSEIVGNLASAFVITGEARYATKIVEHLRAWFVTDSTRMNPHMLYAQAIQGRHTGRGIGIIDAIHFMEVVQAIRILEEHALIPAADLEKMRSWFDAFAVWLSTHTYGLDEMVHPNNHGTCWNMQVGLYALFTGNEAILDSCRTRYREVLLPRQMDVDGSFPLEMERTKPYGYALFNLDAMTMNCLILSTESQDLWSFWTRENKQILTGLEFMHPYVMDKSDWPLPPDVMYWSAWPVAHPAFVFGAIRFDRPDFFEAWQAHRHFLEIEEVRRNVPIRNPLLWIRADRPALGWLWANRK